MFRPLAAGLTLGALLFLGPAAAAQEHFMSWGEEVSNTLWHEQAFVQVAAGGLHTVALRADGTLAAWGDNTGDVQSAPSGMSGQCSDIPPLPAGLRYVEVAAGNLHTAARRSDGQVLAWGLDNLGQSTVHAPPPGLHYVEIAAGGENTIYRLSDGSLLVSGQGLSNVPPPPSGLVYVEISCGHGFAMARLSDGSVAAWGNNSAGQCNVPPLPPGLAYVEIAAGGAHAVARRGDGSLVAWGDNSFGQCNVPVLPSGVFYVGVAAGGAHTLARRSDGSVVAFGDNTRGQCNVPALAAGQTYVEVAAGNEHSVVRRRNGTVTAFGSNSRSQCNAPALPAGNSYAQITAHKVALRSNGQLVSWGGAALPPPPPPGLSYVEIACGGGSVFARLSDGSVAGPGVPALPPGIVYVELAAGPSHTLARRSDGAVVAWGSNSSNQCNVPALPPGITYVQIAAGAVNSAACRSDGTLVAWGAGNDFFGVNVVPPLPAGVTYVEVATSGFHTLARRSDGSAIGWGYNFNGQCDPPALPPGMGYLEIAAASINPISPPSFAVSVARRSDGAVLGFGPNYPYSQNRPLALPPGYSCVEVAARSSMGCARIAPTFPAAAPAIVRVDPAPIEVLLPGEQNTVAISGTGLDSTSHVLLDGSRIDPARYAVVGWSSISLDLPLVTRLGAHELAVTNGMTVSTFPITIVAPTEPRHELGSGNAFEVIDRDDGLTYVASGPPGSTQVVFLSTSSVPSLRSDFVLDIGDQFASLRKIAMHVIPLQGWIAVHLPASALPDPGTAGMALYSQTLELGGMTPRRVSNPQAIWLVR